MIACMIIGTVLFLFYVIFMESAGEESFSQLSKSLATIERDKVEKTKDEMLFFAQRVKEEKLSENKKIRWQAKRMKKRYEQQRNLQQVFEEKRLNPLDCIPLAGYGLISAMKWDKSTPFMKELIQRCSQYKTRQDAARHAVYLVASLIGYTWIGLVLAFVFLGLGIAMDMGIRSVVLFVVAALGIGIIGYLPFDETNVIIKDREAQIERQFPRAMSKMTLLITAGLEISQAWRLTCQKEEGTLYKEMRRVLTGLDNNEPPAKVYQEFMDRCSNKFVNKFASSVLNNRTKGNAEIAIRFQELNTECWSERKHGARRMAEVVQSKLFLPTMLMFVGIIILVIVPVMSGFNMF